METEIEIFDWLWCQGYRAGMTDIQTLISQGADLDKIKEWVENNG